MPAARMTQTTEIQSAYKKKKPRHPKRVNRPRKSSGGSTEFVPSSGKSPEKPNHGGESFRRSMSSSTRSDIETTTNLHDSKGEVLKSNLRTDWSTNKSGIRFTDESLAQWHLRVSEEFQTDLTDLLESKSTRQESVARKRANPISFLASRNAVLISQAEGDSCHRPQEAAPHFYGQLTSSTIQPQTRLIEDSLRVDIFGSSVMRLVLPGSSDVDLNLSFDTPTPWIDFGIDYKQKAMTLLLEKLKNHPRINIVEVRRYARVPLVKVQYQRKEGLGGPLQEIYGDITLSNSLPRYNSNLLRAYGQLNPIVRRLMLLTKFWASRRGIKDASKGFLSSYSYMLLVVFYAQQRLGTPNLQACDETILKRFNVRTREELVKLVNYDDYGCKKIEVLDFPDTEEAMETTSVENLTAGHHCVLFLGFLEFLESLPLETSSISIRKGRIFSKRLNSRDSDTWRWSIEDPFEHFESEAPRDLGCVLKKEKVTIIKEEIKRAVQLLNGWGRVFWGEKMNANIGEYLLREQEAEKTLSLVLSDTNENLVQACAGPDLQSPPKVQPKVVVGGVHQSSIWDRSSDTSERAHREDSIMEESSSDEIKLSGIWNEEVFPKVNYSQEGLRSVQGHQSSSPNITTSPQPANAKLARSVLLNALKIR